MAYRLKRSETVETGVRRVVREQIDEALREIQDGSLDRHVAVHQVRKRCKKIRGALRLVRPSFQETFQRENAFFRDVARNLSGLRDAQALIECYDDLMDTFADQVDRSTFGLVRAALTRHLHDRSENGVDLTKKLDDTLQALRIARNRVDSWRLDEKKWKAVQGGLAKTYKRGRRAMAEAGAEPSDENLHEWRKRVKYHWYHTRLLEPIWTGPMRARRGQMKRLSDLLGNDHDLAVFQHTLSSSPDEFSDEQTLRALTGLIDQRRVWLKREAQRLGTRVYAESPNSFVKRWRQYWRAWKQPRARVKVSTLDPVREAGA